MYTGADCSNGDTQTGATDGDFNCLLGREYSKFIAYMADQQLN